MVSPKLVVARVPICEVWADGVQTKDEDVAHLNDIRVWAEGHISLLAREMVPPHTSQAGCMCRTCPIYRELQRLTTL